MAKTIIIKLTQGGENVGPFTIYDSKNAILDSDVSLSALIAGKGYTIDDDVNSIEIESTGKCKFRVRKLIVPVTQDEYSNASYKVTYKSCVWRHLTDPVHYNFYYDNIEPYVIEYPFSYQYMDEIVQNVTDYTKAFQYTKNPLGVFDSTLRVQPNDKWFNKAILYNDQQSTGMLVLEPKPVNDLSVYNTYPKYNVDSKTILYTKRDNFYHYNSFWNVAIDPLTPLFKGSCTSLSIDKVINQANMDYSTRAFKKATIRAKNLKIRHILDNSSTIHLVSHFIIAPAQNSYL